MRMQKRKFRIGELADQLNIERFVIRFWEKEFNLKTTRSNGGQRFYNEDNFSTFARIKQLLYEEGFTISGAKKKLKEKQSKVLVSQKTTLENEHKTKHPAEQEKIEILNQQIIDLKNKLRKLRELL